MHKRHGEVVSQVLQRKVVENAQKLVDGILEDTSLLALAIAQKHLSPQSPGSTDAARDQCAESDRDFESPSSVQWQGTALARVEQSVRALDAKFDALISGKTREKTKRKPVKRDMVI
jgi:hypothetical protein